mgnify:CR=1 FL=1
MAGNLDEIKNLDNGSWFNKKFQTVRIPTLEEVLKVCRGKIRLNIEIKPSGHDKDLEEQVAKLLKEYHMRDTCVVSSLKYESLQKVKEADSSIRPYILRPFLWKLYGSGICGWLQCGIHDAEPEFCKPCPESRKTDLCMDG